MNRLSDALATSHRDDAPFSSRPRRLATVYICANGPRRRRETPRTPSDLDNYPERDWWERRSRSLLAVSGQILEAVAPGPGEKVSPPGDDKTIIRLTREQRDALLEQLDSEVTHALDGFESNLNTIAAERQIVQDALELEADLAGDEQEYPLRTRLASGLEVDSGWDSAPRSVRLKRLTRRMSASAEAHLQKFPEGRPLPPWATGPLHPEESEEERAAMLDEYRRDVRIEHEHKLKVRETCIAVLAALGREDGR